MGWPTNRLLQQNADEAIKEENTKLELRVEELKKENKKLKKLLRKNEIDIPEGDDQTDPEGEE